MPIPSRNSGESHDDFISRCMSDEIMNSEYPDNDQRMAVCMNEVKKYEATHNLEDIEIFSAGTWNGDSYTIDDIDDIVSSFNEIGSILKPYLKLGHDKDQKLLQKNGYPAAGWVTGLKRKGEKLLATVNNVPDKIKSLIDRKAYGRISPEIYWNLKNGDKVHPRVLKAVALLGGDTPAVGTLDDFINLYTEKEFDGELKIYNGEKDMPEKNDETLELRVKELEKVIAEKEKSYSDLKLEFAELNSKHEKIVKDGKAKEISDFMAAKLAEGKIVPSQVAVYTALSVSDTVHEYEFIHDNKTDKISGTGFELVKNIIESNPKLVEFETKSTAERSEKKLYSKKNDEDNDIEVDKKVKAYAKENNMSYSQAYRELSIKGDNE